MHCAANCELRTVTLSDTGSDGGLDPTWFHPEGHHKSWENGAATGAANGAAAPNGVAA